MRVALNTYTSTQVSMGTKFPKREPISQLLKAIEDSKEATIPPLNLMRGINPNSNNVFDTFRKIDDVTRQINFVKTPEAWDKCLKEELDEYIIARNEYNADKSTANREHMEEEMGDIFYTAASMAKASDINPQEAFKATNRKFFNRINLMERFCKVNPNNPDNLKDCTDQQRRALWNGAKRKLYDAQATRYANESVKLDTQA